MGNSLENNFDGGESPQRQKDTYVPICAGGGINLHLYQMGHYPGCFECEEKPKCKDRGNTAGEQASL